MTDAVIPADVQDIPTPALLVDVPRLEANIAATAAAMHERVALRPHMKTSKCLQVVRRQHAAGAIGFTCSTPVEVRLLGETGLPGILWAHLAVGPAKVAFAVDAATRWQVTLLAESLAQARALSEEVLRRRAAEDGTSAVPDVRLILDVDTGQHRTGVDPAEVPARWKEISDLPGLTLVGVLTHEGQVAAAGAQGREQAGRDAGTVLGAVAADLRARGQEVEVVSIGSTPGMSTAPFMAGITEARPGTYVYFDANQWRLGSCAPEQWALSVLARVVSAEPGPGRAVIIDAGIKAMSSDTLTPQTGAGIVCDLGLRPHPDVEFTTANEEHGFLTGPGTADLAVGDLVRIVPNHACGTTNMFGSLRAVAANGSVETWPILARH